MEECLRLAAKGSGSVSPNPLVGAVLVAGGMIVSRGYHRRFGGPHAEIDCLSRFNGSTRNTVLYVNLEPCVHFGKTPPCVDAIVAAGIPRVVVAMEDPNPRVAGRGIAKLRRAGIRVETGVLEEKARELNRVFARHIVSRRPYIHVKVAQTLDGRIGERVPGQLLISSTESRALVHRWRAEYDAVLIGAGTVIADDPSITVRMARGRNPGVVVLDGALRVPLSAKIFDSRAHRAVILCTSRHAARSFPGKIRTAERRGITVLQFPAARDIFRLRDVMEEIYRHNIGSLLVEGGSQVFSGFAQEGPIDELSIFIAPVIHGSGIPAFADPGHEHRLLRRASSLTVSRSGADLLLRARFGQKE